MKQAHIGFLIDAGFGVVPAEQFARH